MFSSPKPRILIVRLSAIGDVVHGLPVLNALRDDFPDAEIAWVVEELSAPLLLDQPSLSRVLVAPRRWMRSLATMRKAQAMVRGFRPDVTIDLQSLTKSALLARLSGARRRIGFDRPEGREASRWLNNELVRATTRHVVDRNLELLRPLGIETPSPQFSLPRHEADEIFAERALVEMGLSSGFVAINVGAGWASKLWPRERYAQIASQIDKSFHVPSIVTWGSAQERAWAEEVVRLADGHAVLAPKMSLSNLVALVRKARVFIGSDTGPLHIAAAAGTRCIGLFGPWPAERNGPYGPGNIVLQKMVVSGGTKERRAASNEAMEAISVEDVCCACERVLGADQRKAA